MTITWCIVPEIASVMDITFCHFGLFFALLPSKNNPKSQNFQKNGKKHLKILSFYKHTWQSYGVWFLRYGVQGTEFLVILDHFLPFYLPNNPKNQNFDNHMMYGFWDTKHNRHRLMLFWTIFCSFNPLTTQNIKIWKNERKGGGNN